MSFEFTAWLIPPLSVVILLWPAVWNGYPIVFADTGTYLTQAMHHYLGWDRPVFYSLFIYPWHLGISTWPVILMQSCVTVLVLDLTRRGFGLPRPWLLALTAFLAAATWLPWTVSELIPDLFTPLLVLLLCLLVFTPSRFRPRERLAMLALAIFMIASQQSSVPLSFALLAAMIPAGCIGGGWRRSALVPLLAPVCAIVAMTAVNFAGHGRLSISPFGNVFLLARVIYDGPGMAVLRRECPIRAWRLCPYLDRFPATSDDFLWLASSPIMLAGGHKAVSADAGAILHAAAAAAPGEMLRATWNNTLAQLDRFDSGDGLNAWDAQVGTTINGAFPEAESRVFQRARQQTGSLMIPPALGGLHRAAALAGIAAALGLLPFAWRRRHVAGWFLAVALLTLPISAAITGGLSTPHERYQSRIVWLPAAMALLTVPALFSRPRAV